LCFRNVSSRVKNGFAPNRVGLLLRLTSARRSVTEMSCFVYQKQIIDVVEELSHEFFRPKFQLELVIAPQCRLEITLIKIERYFVGTQD